MTNNKALVFDIIAPVAHFRTFYTNASSLTYGFPPRTTIIGLISAILGYERDSYYPNFSQDKCRIAISIRVPVRKIIHTVNFVRTKKEEFSSFKQAIKSYLNSKIKTYPTSIEVVLPDSEENNIKYRVFFSHNDKNVYGQLHEKLTNSHSEFSLYLGISEFLAWYEYIGEFVIFDKANNNNVRSVISESFIDSIDFPNCKSLSLMVETMPVDFECINKERKLKRSGKYIYEKNCKAIPLKSLEGIYSINSENIVWM